MNQNKIFNITRWRLAAWYAGVMGVILSLSGLAIYEVMDRVHWHALHQELELVSGTLHDSLEPKLRQSGRIENSVEQSLPGLCVTGQNCPGNLEKANRHLLGVVQQAGYYVRFLDPSGQIIATLGYQPEGLPVETQTLWQTLQDRANNRYHQISLLLKTESGNPWGYLQVGRSLKDFDDHLISLRFVILLGLPLTLLLITAASWRLAGLAMRPVYCSYRQIQQFTGDAAHELRTPLAAIRATVESVLQMPQLSETETRSLLQAVERQNNRLSQLVQDLLLLSRMDIQGRSLKTQPCCLNDIISDILEEYAALVMTADICLTSDIRVNQPLFVSGDEEQLYRLLENLVTNAIQYTPQNGKVTIILDQDDRHALFQVQDTGIGVAAKDQLRIFDRFYRVSGDRSRQTGGAGLGLSIAQAIAQAHESDIQVQSELGKGSTFTMRLLLKSPDLKKQRLH